MSETLHRYTVSVRWSGNDGTGTSSYRSYRRTHQLHGPGKPPIPGSADPAFRGESDRWNPEELLVGSVVACHQLWYLHLCADAGVVVVGYEDRAEGVLALEAGGAGQFVEIVLRPHVVFAPGSDVAKALSLHHQANAMCFVARSLTCPVTHEPVVTIATETRSGSAT